MQNISTHFATFAVALFALLPFHVVAAGKNYIEPQSKYIFHFVLQNNQLTIANDPKDRYDVIPDAYVSTGLNPSMTDFVLVIQSIKGVTLAKIGFNNPQGAGPKKTSFDVQAPYFDNNGKVLVLNREGKSVLDFSVANTATCNENGKCDADAGETHRNCPVDCSKPTHRSSALQ